ncbi:LCP family protein [Aeromicrobium duanguangcaii]|uniref:LCP family protein n=1 Tax=Aeromicrobium duanguangcaii TaxID=2968086 RepID=UPI00201735D2|nr:LCP family protein [Aeromicrobium duanguangcaii]MCL3838703.1 LCP family protein [Aeromicrobium duanguangcaii]
MSPSGPSDGDGYDWLYEDESGRHRPRPAASGSAVPPPNLPPPGSKGSRPKRSKDRKEPKARKPRGRWRLLWLILVLWLAFLLIVPIVAWSKITKVDATPDSERPQDKATTWLIVGTDKRPKDRSRGRTDTILLLTYGGGGPSVLTSIPRDSLVNIPGHGRTKVNAAYAYGGPPLLVETMEGATGLRIDGYTEIGFVGLRDVVDALGGIEICPDQDIKDKDARLNIKKGCQEVDGKTALGYSRSRKAFGTGDIARGQHQREVIGAIGKAALSPSTVLNPFTYSRVATTAAESLAVGDDVSMFSFGRFAWKLARAVGGDGRSCTVPIANLAVEWDRERALKYFGHLKNGTTDELGTLCTEDGMRD